MPPPVFAPQYPIYAMPVDAFVERFRASSVPLPSHQVLLAEGAVEEWGAAETVTDSAGRTRLLDAWWMSFFPGVAIFLTVLALNLAGEGLNDAMNPRLARERE